MTERKLLYIEWTDSRGCHASWQHVEAIADDEPCKLRSVGWVIKDTRDHIHLAPHIGDDPEQVCGDMIIPKLAITKRRVVKIGSDADHKRIEDAAKKVLHDKSRSKAAVLAAAKATARKRKAEPE